MKKAVRAAALLTALVFLAVVVSVPFGIALEADHDCEGEHCPVCALIAACAGAVAHLVRAAVTVCALFVLTAGAAFLGSAPVRIVYDRTTNGIRLLT